MSNELMAQKENDLSVWENDLSLKEIRELFAPNLTDLEFKAFVGMGKATGLNPFLRELWSVKYDKTKPAQIFIGRDGYRKIAQQHPAYDYHRVEAVYSEDNYVNDNGDIRHTHGFANRGTLLGAYCVVKRKDATKEMVTSVLFSEYDKKQSNWMSMKETMIKKVAECQGFKTAFQEKFSGLHHEYEASYIINTVGEQKITQKDRLNSLLEKKGLKHEAIIESDNNHIYTADSLDDAKQSCAAVIDSQATNKGAIQTEVVGNGASKAGFENEKSNPAPCTKAQLDDIEFKFELAEFDSERRVKALKHFNVSTFPELTFDQANELIKIIEKA